MDFGTLNIWCQGTKLCSGHSEDMFGTNADVERPPLLARANIADNVCNPYFNNMMCDYDGGDCCAAIVSYEMCSIGLDCRCHYTGKMHQTFKTGNTCINIF